MRAESKKLLFDIAEACRAIVDFNSPWTIIRDKVPELLRAADELLQEPDSA